jgi:hypothetical protein
MPNSDDLVRWCRAERARLQQQLEQLESGALKTWERRGSSAAPTRDVTEESVERVRRSITELHAILAKHPDC